MRRHHSATRSLSAHQLLQKRASFFSGKANKIIRQQHCIVCTPMQSKIPAQSKIVDDRTQQPAPNVERPIKTVARDFDYTIRRQAEFERQLDDFTAKNYQRSELGLPDYARAMALSERHFSRMVHAVKGQSFAPFLREYRLMLAVTRLINGEQITAVSYSVGFSSLTYFSTCFRAQFGLSPRQFIECVKNNRVPCKVQEFMNWS